jgi:hypothetical protein
VSHFDHFFNVTYLQLAIARVTAAENLRDLKSGIYDAQTECKGALSLWCRMQLEAYNQILWKSVQQIDDTNYADMKCSRALSLLKRFWDGGTWVYFEMPACGHICADVRRYVCKNIFIARTSTESLILMLWSNVYKRFRVDYTGFFNVFEWPCWLERMKLIELEQNVKVVYMFSQAWKYEVSTRSYDNVYRTAKLMHFCCVENYWLYCHYTRYDYTG